MKTNVLPTLTAAEKALVNRIVRAERLDCNLLNTFAEWEAAKTLRAQGLIGYLSVIHAYIVEDARVIRAARA